MKAPHGGRPPVWRAKAEFRRIIRPMKQQIANRLGVAHVRDTIIQLVAGSITREQVMESLEIGKKGGILSRRGRVVDTAWANPKRRKLYHKLEVTECVYLKFWTEPPRSLWDPLCGKIANFMHIVIYAKVGSQHVFMSA